MIIKIQDNIRKAKSFFDHVIYITTEHQLPSLAVDDEPTSFTQANKSSQWCEAMAHQTQRTYYG